MLSLLMQKYVSLVSQCASLLVVSGVFFVISFTAVLIFLRLWVRWRAKSLLPHLRQDSKGRRLVTVGFFHPYCNAGGGGERVLWVAIRSLQKKHSNVSCVVYTGDIDAKPEEILGRARQRFNIVLPKPIEFVYLRRRQWVEACKYPYFTLLGQSLGSLYLGWEALMNFVPDLYIDSMGYAFTVPLFKYFGGSKVACYVHYPTISTDMLQKVTDRTQSFNNASFIARSSFLSSFKLMYYKIFAYLYGVAGKRNDVVMVNSTWTFNHIQALWSAGNRTHIVYPSCDVSEFVKIPLEKSLVSKERTMVSVAQFRPEKNHSLQVKSFAKFLETVDSEWGMYKLVLVGGCRNEGDAERVEALRGLCRELGVENSVDFKLNISFEELKSCMASAVLGLHSMWNEHFGIGVVELMAAGTVIIAHNSGGPKLDIVVPFNEEPTGFLADDEESYVGAMTTVFRMSDDDRLRLRSVARQSVSRFSDEQFERSFLAVVDPVLKSIEDNGGK
ncbi:GDP-Man:Man(3)GlcNAc(2)-PP-Dol alpha-1,2-mannosyltransferase-like isoform X1 [Haliotis rufescens]|uniref:GDP-Man:Man(3)GlcNAc(2)-PP-Dol alpha-1,2-mannosyltransferase-like isoform X1 n=1 Tax=Haliotis rufescens TaxID=6454 RepID=UPI00201F0E91|nr:GDP-Man:Man(3)GlcNAc(2)-PP-Dol alpha-1,2-mannosyltransferase-like isoform X1 [Haliotis rufescens]XP_046359735.2 GDP-Man:Man(3)GlcNAc(2)-PP-Dol alpha-1,2-mannosyltransferase-like isoform X1 [Haliotis rufescens]XP_046359736.2 GDP-Man:Man(3)GlcNAc(2)-PP-Dol alpha-1,2-mannosyltransferase-like isoform X1 [Haliotis rufescens]